MVQHPGENREYFAKQHTHLLFNLAIPLLQVHSKGTDSPNHMQAQMHEILNATEFIVTKCWTAPIKAQVVTELIITHSKQRD